MLLGDKEEEDLLLSCLFCPQWEILYISFCLYLSIYQSIYLPSFLFVFLSIYLFLFVYLPFSLYRLLSPPSFSLL